MLPDGSGLKERIIKVSQQAVEASKPCNWAVGTVESANPIQVRVDQKLLLSDAQLVLTRNVTDYKVEATILWESEKKSGGSGEDSFASHSHVISGRKELIVHNGLAVGEKVFLLREQGGQRYIIVDRFV